MTEKRRIAVVVTRKNLGDPESDLAYWLAQPPEARLTALEEIRQDYIRWKYDVQPRLQRVFTIIELTQGPLSDHRGVRRRISRTPKIHQRP